MNDRKIKRGSDQRPRKDFPYYKLQYYEERLRVWRDCPPAFQTLAELEEYRRLNAPPDQSTRVMIVEGDRKRRVFDESDDSLER